MTVGLASGYNTQTGCKNAAQEWILQDLMLTGLVFDIKEFSIHDGPGIRTTVFLKGCPLSCMWCHNPEGQSSLPLMMQNLTGDRLAGQYYKSSELAQLLNRQASIFRLNEGGVTFSGGEPLLQAEFLAEVIDQLDHVHVLLDTSGQGGSIDLQLLLHRVDLVYYDLKLIDPISHRRYTGQENNQILDNLFLVNQSGVPFVIRVPLIPSITDTHENLSAIADTVRDLPGLMGVELLPYNRSAGAKYHAAGMTWKPDFNENDLVNSDVSIFTDLGIQVSVK